jgi:hypothetical protein
MNVHIRSAFPRISAFAVGAAFNTGWPYSSMQGGLQYMTRTRMFFTEALLFGHGRSNNGSQSEIVFCVKPSLIEGKVR